VTSEVGVTSGSLYSRFGSWGAYREALVRWWAEHRYRDHFLAGLAGTTDPREALAKCVELGMSLDPAGRALRMWAAEDTELAELIERGDHDTVAVLVALLEQTGLAPLDATLRAWVLFAAFAGLYLLKPPTDVIANTDRLLEWLAER
jgi:AcrR family transcriptional regulator